MQNMNSLTRSNNSISAIYFQINDLGITPNDLTILAKELNHCVLKSNNNCICKSIATIFVYNQLFPQLVICQLVYFVSLFTLPTSTMGPRLLLQNYFSLDQQHSLSEYKKIYSHYPNLNHLQTYQLSLNMSLKVASNSLLQELSRLSLTSCIRQITWVISSPS